MQAVSETAAANERRTRAERIKPPYGCTERGTAGQKITKKVFEKLFKNPLTKSRECDIIFEPICEAKAELKPSERTRRYHEKS